MIDFRKLMSADEVLRFERTKATMADLYYVSDKCLATELLKLARSVRQEFQDRLFDPYGAGYDARFVWQVVPEIAKRLGERYFLPHEARAPQITKLDGPALRRDVGDCLKFVSIDRWPSKIPLSDTPSPARILCHYVTNGNPVAMALDRICPAPKAGFEGDDWIAKHLREITDSRGHAKTPYWSPAIQGRGPNHWLDADDDMVISERAEITMRF